MFDLLGICETKEQIDSGFLANVSLPGYNMHSTPSKGSAGGVALYIKSSLNYKLREDLKFTNDGFKMIGVEIINSKNKNILCCCIYRHPNSDVQEFTHFVNGILQTVTKENKHVFFLGDFNLNLLNYEHHSETNDFLNSMVSHYLLPHILHPTRVTDHSATIIDNIFSNITDSETKSGNILCEISDHYPQFIILDKVIPDYKSCSFAKHDYSNFDETKFIEDFSAMVLIFFMTAMPQ